MKTCFLAADILLPKTAMHEKWSVIACDQFTSDRAYWDRVEAFVGAQDSTFHMVFPEIDLENEPAVRIAKIHKAMEDALCNDVFSEYKDSFVYVERTLQNGMIRPGIVGAVDLEQYHYDPKQKPNIGATEQTVLERIPPRIAVRRNADLEFPHIILFCNDEKDQIIKLLQDKKDQLPKLYDFDLMENGGHICGWLVSGADAEMLQNALDRYAAENADKTAFLVADGNHSLVTAKSWYEEVRANNPDQDLSDHPARYAMVELENILDDSIAFEPIHRVIFDTDPDKLLADIQAICAADGIPLTCLVGQKRYTVKLNIPEGELPIAVLQKFLDDWLKKNAGKIDYIHDAEAVENFAMEKNAIGILLPSFDKSELFAFGATGHILPRKTFSLGHSREKRYYLEGRKIK